MEYTDAQHVLFCTLSKLLTLAVTGAKELNKETVLTLSVATTTSGPVSVHPESVQTTGLVSLVVTLHTQLQQPASNMLLCNNASR